MTMLIHSIRIDMRPDTAARTEREIFNARVASYDKWNRRRRVLRLRARLFGRRKLRRRDQAVFQGKSGACVAPEAT